MDATQVVIHFIGIVLFSTQVSNDPGLHAILPAIPHAAPEPPILKHRHHPAVAMALEPSPDAAPAGPSTVESHVALLIFRHDVVANDSQWQTSAVVSRFPLATALASYKYVELTGEHIAFIVDAPSNPPAVLPPNMPRFSCPTILGLESGYQWPYSMAAAAVDIPAGILSVCHTSSGRIDTQLTLNATGTLTIVAAKSGVVKTLVLRTTHNPTIYLTNIPPWRVKGIAAATTGASHFQAYFEMIDRIRFSSCSGFPRVAEGAPPVLACEPLLSTLVPTAPVVDDRFTRMRRRIRALFRPAGPVAVKEAIDVGEAFAAVNAECSNTQWP